MPKSKNELDKEIMYRKIMPTARHTSVKEVQDPAAGIPSHEAKNIEDSDIVADTARTPEAFSFTPALAGISHAHTQRPPSVNRTTAASRQIQESRDMILVNVMEDLVLSRLDETLARFNCCKCNKCKKDIAAIALNKLTPRYMVMKEHDEEKRRMTEEEYGSAVTSALIQAILTVKKSPRH